MKNIIQSFLEFSYFNKVPSNIRLGLIYFCLLSLITIVGFLSVSTNRYISNTISITLSDPEHIGDTTKDDVLTPLLVIIKSGDTLRSIFNKQGLSDDEIEKIVKILPIKSNQLKIGQKITFDYEYKIIEDENDLTNESKVISSITIEINKSSTLTILRKGGNFIIKNSSVSLEKTFTRYSATIKSNSNFISTLKSMGIPANNVIELIKCYSYHVDFQRQVHTGDVATIIVETFISKGGDLSHYGNIVYASLILSGKEHNIYRYSPNKHSKSDEFFSEDGRSVRRSLLRTPVNIVRISSHYGSRKHPIQGFHKMHKGVDFSAPSGTPIYAAGCGVITEISWKSGYGKFIQIKHSPTLSTSYAHASSFVKGLKVGSKVNQGQIIAYVGSTGRTTGSHLHYEVKINGKNVNPMSIKTTAGLELTGKQLENFKTYKNKIKNLNYNNKLALNYIKN